MAVAKARSSKPVRGYYVETVQTGRIIRTTGGTGTSAFGLPRLGGLMFAEVDGLTGGGTAAGKMFEAAPIQPHAPLAVSHAAADEAKRAEEAKRKAEEAKKVEDARKAEEAKKAAAAAAEKK